MYFPIRVELGDLVSEFGLDSESVDQLSNMIVTNVTIEFLNALQSNVNRSLKGARNTYLRNIEVVDIDSKNKEIVLHGWLPNAIEDGYPAFDMKPGFSRSQNVEFNKNGGWYLTIPFHFSTPGSLGEGTTKIPNPIYNIVRKQKNPLTKGQIPEPYNKPLTRSLVSNSQRVFGPYTHKSSIYEGLQKTEGGYITFRTVGANSDPNAFIHKGFKGRKFFETSLEQISPSVPVVTENAINQFLNDLNL